MGWLDAKGRERLQQRKDGVLTSSEWPSIDGRDLLAGIGEEHDTQAELPAQIRLCW